MGPQPSPKAAVHRSGAPSATPHDTEKRYYAAADKLPLKDGFEDKFAAFRSVEDAYFVTTSYLLTHDECFA